MSNTYFDIGAPYKTDDGHVHSTKTFTVTAGVGSQTVMKYTPGINGVTPSASLLAIWGYSFTDIGVNEANNLHHYRSRLYIIRRPTSSAVEYSEDEVITPSVFTLTVNASSPYDITLNVARHATLDRQVTLIVDAYVPPGIVDLCSLDL